MKRRKNNVRFKALEKILEELGFEERRSKKGTSHRVFSHPKLSQNIVLVSHGKNDPVKFYQVNDVIKALQELGNNKKKNSEYYLSLEYPITIERMDDGIYCASIPLLNGCKGYGGNHKKALDELKGVKETLLEMMLNQRKPIPEPTIRLEIPASTFSRIRNKKQLERFVRV